MYNVEENTLTLGGKTEPVLRLEVWWMVPFAGLFTTEEKDVAIRHCREMEMNPQLHVLPVPVAVAETLYEPINR